MSNNEEMHFFTLVTPLVLYICFTVFSNAHCSSDASIIDLTAAPNPPNQQHFLQQFITRWAAVVGHRGREIPTQLIFYCITESHLDQTVT